jgi:hypothetical protein
MREGSAIEEVGEAGCLMGSRKMCEKRRRCATDLRIVMSVLMFPVLKQTSDNPACFATDIPWHPCCNAFESVVGCAASVNDSDEHGGLISLGGFSDHVCDEVG